MGKANDSQKQSYFSFVFFIIEIGKKKSNLFTSNENNTNEKLDSKNTISFFFIIEIGKKILICLHPVKTIQMKYLIQKFQFVYIQWKQYEWKTRFKKYNFFTRNESENDKLRSIQYEYEGVDIWHFFLEFKTCNLQPHLA